MPRARHQTHSKEFEDTVMSIKGMFKTLRITKEEGYLSLRELRLACLLVFPCKGRVELGLKG